MGVLKDLFKGYEKTKTIKPLTYDELFEIIKDAEFPCGKPAIEGNGIMRCIKFPPVDKYVIQVAISSRTITVSKVYSGVGGFVKESAGDALTGGWYNSVNSENIELNKMTETVRDEIVRLLDEKGLVAQK